ncbi:hypothetical protein [Cupriavidus sp. 8B]
MATVTKVSGEWEFRFPSSGRLAYHFNWLYGIQTITELARRSPHEPRFIEMAERYDYVYLEEPASAKPDPTDRALRRWWNRSFASRIETARDSDHPNWHHIGSRLQVTAANVASRDESAA